VKKKEILKLLQESFDEIKKLSSDIKFKFSEKIILKGKKSKLDSIDIVTMLSFYEKKFEKKYNKKINILDENFFNKFENIDIKKIADFSLKNYEKK
jgi:hypothetical protein